MINLMLILNLLMRFIFLLVVIGIIDMKFNLALLEVEKLQQVVQLVQVIFIPENDKNMNFTPFLI